MIAATITVALVLGYEQTQALLASWHARLVQSFIDERSPYELDRAATEAKAHNDRVRLALEMLDGIIKRLRSAPRSPSTAARVSSFRFKTRRRPRRSYRRPLSSSTPCAVCSPSPSTLTPRSDDVCSVLVRR